MIPTLVDVARITDLRVDGQAVMGVTYTSYQELAERLLGLDVTRERSSLIPRTKLQTSLGVVSARHQTGESQADYMARMTEDATKAALAEEEGATADRDLRRFLILVIGKLILGTRGDPVWAYHHLSSLGRGEPRWAGAVPLLRRWRFRRDEQSLRQQVTSIHVALDTVPFGHVQWTPYVGEDDAAQPWVERGRPYFGRDIWLHSFNTVVPLHDRLVARTLGLHQAVVEFPSRQRPWERPGRSFRGIQQETDWTVRVREQLTDWEQRGREVASEATSDEDYFCAYERRYGAQVYKGSRRSFDPEGRIASLEGILHSSIRQRDDLQAIVDQLREELDRAQQMVGGASSSREDPGRSVLEGQLAAAVARAEDALAQAREREAELRDSLARTTALEAEMVELRLRPEAAEVMRWHREAEKVMRLHAEVGDLRTQLGEERHRCELLRSEMKGLERALALAGRSRSSISRSGILSGSARHYLTGSSRRRRNEEEARRRERAPEGSETISMATCGRGGTGLARGDESVGDQQAQDQTGVPLPPPPPPVDYRALMQGLVHAMQTQAQTTAALQAQVQARAPAQEAVFGGVPMMERFRRMTLPFFKGESDPILAESWLRETEKIFRALRCAEEERVTLATYML
ncbi:hypothetical protein Taro_049260 [Colocasia esculenta]|uniref:Aminotransferase-like plant mobile domain-containing protein n=1 Tax=Colocasia esculenta TaxID=4460 RepID=A0A843XAA4_COLES|nr:hypothetical protein [Colocasia esculenta]